MLGLRKRINPPSCFSFLPLCFVTAAGTYLDMPRRRCLADGQTSGAVLVDLFFSPPPTISAHYISRGGISSESLVSGQKMPQTYGVKFNSPEWVWVILCLKTRIRASGHGATAG